MADTLPSPGVEDPVSLADKAVKDKVHRYYQATTRDYLRYYETGWHHHMHFGFDRDLPEGGNPTEHMVRYLAGLAGVKASDRVLDAGCGVGGSAIWLAREIGCRSLGITLVESQARLAVGFAAKRKVGGNLQDAGRAGGAAAFVVNDFSSPAFKPGFFDVVWAVESFDHAPDKCAWVESMHAILRPGGRLIIADGFRTEVDMSRGQARAYGRFLEGWAVPHLCTGGELDAYASAAGFARMHGEDLTEDVLPHSRAIYRFGFLFIPWRWGLRRLGLSSPEKLGNALATFYQYRTLKRGLWQYRVHCYRKPWP